MPDNKVHKYVSKKFLGRANEEVNKLMDLPAKVIKNPKHRMFFHDPLSLYAMFGGDQQALEAALFHLWLDEFCSANKNAEAIFEFLSKVKK